MDDHRRDHAGFPVSAGVVLGLGLGGFVDGILLHQVLQWHHLLTSAGYPGDSVHSLEVNTLWDGLFHVGAFGLTLLGIGLLWRAARRPHRPWSNASLTGAILMGFGAFNLAEGIINHQLLGLHHVNETAPQAQWIWWDLGFLAWGLVMLAVGRVLVKIGRADEAGRAPTEPSRPN